MTHTCTNYQGVWVASMRAAAVALCVGAVGAAEDAQGTGASAPATPVIRFRETDVTSETAWDAAWTEARYAFENTSGTPVRVDISTPCGCVATVADPNPVPPGGTGTMTAKLTIGHRTGMLVKTLTVKTEPAGAGPITLKFTTNVPVVMRAKPAFVHWGVGDEPQAQQSIVEVKKDFPVTITDMVFTKSVLNATMDINPDRTRATITIVPRSTAQPWNGTVLLKTNIGRDQLIYVRCIAPDSPPSKPLE